MARTLHRAPVDHARLARIRRDESLGRVSRLTKSIGIGIVAVTGVFGLYLSKALPGHATTPNTANSASTSSTGSSTTGTSPASRQLSPPAAPPVQSQQPAPVVSGAS
ncbi:MAG TPA: hypothetical protein VG298_04060 [Acidimicrobiales bacterium]|nr:hypothetical protein [Acidimicrobiales bacterium]